MSLVEWFLRQQTVRGYNNAIFSGLTTLEVAKVIKQYVLHDTSLYGVYHVAAEPICKHDLLSMIAHYYQKEIAIEPYSDFYINRSLNGSKFTNKTGYIAPKWEILIQAMYEDYRCSKYYQSNIIG